MHSHALPPWRSDSHTGPDVKLPPPPRRVGMKPGRDRRAGAVFIGLIVGTLIAVGVVAMDTISMAWTLAGAMLALARGDASLALKLGMPALPAFVATVVVGAIVWPLWHFLLGLPRRHKYLLRHGAPAVGVVTGKSIDTRSYSDIHHVYYSWAAPHGERDDHAVVAPDEYLSTQPGQPLTILFDPRRPNRNTPLQYADYTILS